MSEAISQVKKLIGDIANEMKQNEEKLKSSALEAAALKLVLEDRIQFQLDKWTNLALDHQSPTMLAIQATVMIHFGMEEDRVHYLRRRGWTMGGMGWWTNKELGFDQLLFAKAVETQVKADTQPFMSLLEALRPKLNVAM